MSAPTKDLCIIRITEKTSIKDVKRIVLNAFLEGFYCFKFELVWHGRYFFANQALPEDADEDHALEMAEAAWGTFCATLTSLITKRR
jgi:hypothetical protein